MKLYDLVPFCRLVVNKSCMQWKVYDVLILLLCIDRHYVYVSPTEKESFVVIISFGESNYMKSYDLNKV